MSSFGATTRAVGALIIGHLRWTSALRMDLSPTVYRSLFPEGDRDHRMPLAILRKVPGRLGREGVPRELEIFPEDPAWTSKVQDFVLSSAEADFDEVEEAVNSVRKEAWKAGRTFEAKYAILLATWEVAAMGHDGSFLIALAGLDCLHEYNHVDDVQDFCQLIVSSNM